MPRLKRLAARLRDDSGVAVIELGIALPVLSLLAIGTFDVSRMVAQRIDYQQALAEVATLALARPPQSDTAYLRSAVATAAEVDASQVNVATSLYCDGVLSDVVCTTGQEQARYVSLTVNGGYTPLWTSFGVGGRVPMTVTRTLRIQ